MKDSGEGNLLVRGIEPTPKQQRRGLNPYTYFAWLQTPTTRLCGVTFRLRYTPRLLGDKRG